ncbi:MULTISPECIES: LysR family transcriptional regulator [unclassified Caballeronia]|uniref:LysR family transcriptional regulator n=1 Tax=unclassified Caballeronia TaxID=2646786 RepID=UPI0028653CC0|nr:MULTISPECIES: LysR family transcriptional regulator [unclassified Caballeronia]MDR5754770.1 LysR family transcriptional regulator [Caballeronia sp. LZ024]MDR5839728.1 LysR family transcriptional regulator [Caballeronia sp. LZ031]
MSTLSEPRPDVRDAAPDTAQVAKALSVSLHQLRLFITLARHRSFTRAGDEFGITQSAVSRSIRELEDEIALRLFDRTTRQVALTDAGRKLIARVAPLVEELEATLRPRSGDSAEPGIVQFASSSSLTASVLPAWLASCAASHPDLSIALVDRPQNQVLQLVRAGEADLGVVIAPDNVSELVAEPLFDDPLCALVPACHPLASQRSAHWRALRGASLLVLDDDAESHAATERALMLHDVAGTTRQRLAQAQSVMQMVEAGLGIGVMPMHACAAWAGRGVQAVVLTPEASRSIMLVRRKGRALRAGAAHVWAHVVAASLARRSASPTLRAVEA